MAELKCKDGTVIKISDETEAELRKAFEKPKYKDCALSVEVIGNTSWPIRLSTETSVLDKYVTRDVEDTEAFIVALQKAVEYCKQHNLGLGD